MANVLRYLIYIVVALFVPLLLVGNPPADVLRRRYVIVLVAAILGGAFTGLAAGFPGLVGAASADMKLADPFPAFVLAAASGTVLSVLGDLFFGSSMRAKTG